MLVHIEIKEIERFLFFIPSNHKGLPKRKRVWFYGLAITHRMLRVSSTVSEVFLGEEIS